MGIKIYSNSVVEPVALLISEEDVAKVISSITLDLPKVNSASVLFLLNNFATNLFLKEFIVASY